MTRKHELVGIDGRNPLGFVAALGVTAAIGCRLRWGRDGQRQVPVLVDLPPHLENHEALIAALAESLRDIPYAYRLADSEDEWYDDFRGGDGKAESEESRASRNGTPASKGTREEDEEEREEDEGAGVRVVKEEIFRAALARCEADQAELERLTAHTCAIALRGERPMTTEVRSVSGQTRYLSTTLRGIVTGARPEDLRRAMFEQWTYRDGPKLGLDPNGFVGNITVDVSKLGSICEIGAERLACEGLRALPTSMQNGTLLTRGYTRDGSAFRWPVWERPYTLREASALLGSRALFTDTTKPRALPRLRNWMAAYGIASIYESPVKRYGLRRAYKILEPSILVA
jgi:hypothetical protein